MPGRSGARWTPPMTLASCAASTRLGPDRTPSAVPVRYPDDHSYGPPARDRSSEHYEFLTAVKGRRVLVERASAERLVDSYLVGSRAASGTWERRRISGGMV